MGQRDPARPAEIATVLSRPLLVICSHVSNRPNRAERSEGYLDQVVGVRVPAPQLARSSPPRRASRPANAGDHVAQIGVL
jgi:hypothetical protein